MREVVDGRLGEERGPGSGGRADPSSVTCVSDPLSFDFRPGETESAVLFALWE